MTKYLFRVLKITPHAPKDHNTNAAICKIYLQYAKMKGVMMRCTRLSERSCSKFDHHYSPDGCSAPALPRVTNKGSGLAHERERLIPHDRMELKKVMTS